MGVGVVERKACEWRQYLSLSEFSARLVALIASDVHAAWIFRAVFLFVLLTCLSGSGGREGGGGAETGRAADVDDDAVVVYLSVCPQLLLLSPVLSHQCNHGPADGVTRGCRRMHEDGRDGDHICRRII